MNAIFKKLTAAATIASIVAVASLGAATPAAAWGWGHGGGWGFHRGGGWGGPVAAGVLGGLAVGALATAASQPGYYGGGPCYLTNRPVTDGWGNVVGYRRVEVCN